MRAEFRRARHIVSADPGSCLIDGTGPQGSLPIEKRASLEQVAVVPGYETISGPYTVLSFQDMENIGSPFTSPALSVLFCDISDQVRETTLAATHAGEASLIIHDSELSCLCPPPSVQCQSGVNLRILTYAFSGQNSNWRRKQKVSISLWGWYD